MGVQPVTTTAGLLVLAAFVLSAAKRHDGQGTIDSVLPRAQWMLQKSTLTVRRLA